MYINQAFQSVLHVDIVFCVYVLRTAVYRFAVRVRSDELPESSLRVARRGGHSWRCQTLQTYEGVFNVFFLKLFLQQFLVKRFQCFEDVYADVDIVLDSEFLQVFHASRCTGNDKYLFSILEYFPCFWSQFCILIV